MFFAAHKSGEKRQGTAEDRDDLSLSAERVSKFSALGKANNAGVRIQRNSVKNFTRHPHTHAAPRLFALKFSSFRAI